MVQKNLLVIVKVVLFFISNNANSFKKRIRQFSKYFKKDKLLKKE